MFVLSVLSVALESAYAFNSELAVGKSEIVLGSVEIEINR